MPCILWASHSGYGTGRRAGGAGFLMAGAAAGSGRGVAGEGLLMGRTAGVIDVDGIGATEGLAGLACTGVLILRRREDDDGPGCD